MCLQTSGAVSDELSDTPKKAEPPELEPVFSDDFSKDTRSDYQIKGDVSWEASTLTLAEGASITRKFNGGTWAKVKLDFGDDGWPAGKDSAELRLWFLLDGTTSCFLRLQRSPDGDDGQVASVGLFDTVVKDGQLVAQIVRETSLADATLSRLIVAYRQGLITVTVDKSVLLTAHIANGAATVTGFLVQAADGFHELDGWIATSLPTATPLPEEQQRRAAEAESANRRLIASYREGKLAEAAEIGERVLEIRKTILGEEHPDYATSLNNLGGLYVSMGEYARAEPLYLRACDIRKKVLGEENPYYATSLNNLGGLYVSMGEYARAEPLCLQARGIRKKVLGEEHHHYAISLNSLAVLYESMGEYGRAEPLYLQARDNMKRVLGEEHPEPARTGKRLDPRYWAAFQLSGDWR